MVLNARLDGDVAILSNFGGLLNDPRHFDAGRDVRELLDRGVRKFVLEMSNIRELGTTALGLLVTITRLVRQAGGEIVLAKPGKGVVAFLEEMRMDDYWDVVPSIEAAIASLDDPDEAIGAGLNS
jgi:anti-sigma B factor antagonist